MAKTTKEKNKELALDHKQLKHYGLVLRLYPDEEQSDLCERTFGCSRLIYNKYLDTRQEYYKSTGETLSVFQYKREILTPSKQSEEFSFLKEVDKFALEFACESVQDAYARFFKGQNKYPTFKSKHKSKKSYTTKFTNNNIEVVDSTCVKLPKLGKVKIAKIKSTRNKRILNQLHSGDAQIKKATISRKGSRYYVSLTIEETIPLVEKVSLNDIEDSKIIGIDLGLKTFAAIHNGKNTLFIEKMNYIKFSEKKLAKLQRQLSKKTKYSSNFYKATAKVAKMQEHISNQRKDFIHKLSTKIANENQIVILETLNIKGMVKNRKLAKAISDAGWYKFITFLKYKLEDQGKHFIQIDRWFASSKVCSHCNEKNVALSLNDREWACSCCGTVHERDENAAINIRNEGLRTVYKTV